MKNFYTLIISSVLTLLAVASGTADVKPSSMFGNYMVLQRNMPVPVWGHASPGEKVSVSFAGQTVATTADDKGIWKLNLAPLKTSAEGRKFTISGNNTIVFKDVLVGEVWICSGQSNMQLGWGDKKDPYYSWGSVKELRSLVPDAKKKPIRSFTVPTFVALTPQDNCRGKWAKSPSGSAVAFGFSYFLNKELNVPVAVITTCWGSSCIEGWMPIELTEKLPHYKAMMKRFEKKNKKKVKALIEKGKKSGKDSKSWSQRENIYVRQLPNILYNAMLHPLIPYAVRGMVWYQGEANSKTVKNEIQYAESLKIWVQTLRKLWGKDNFYFLAVMLPGFGKISGKGKKDPEYPDSASWAWMRESQMKIEKLPYTAVANTIDLGELKNIHPRDKKPLCERLALLVAKNINKKDIVAEGPAFTGFEVNGNKLIVKFKNAEGLKTLDGKSPKAFWLADKKGSWHKAEAEIKGNSVILHSSEVTKPVACRYAFAAKPKVNLVNGAGLPAYPFRTDKWSFKYQE